MRLSAKVSLHLGMLALTRACNASTACRVVGGGAGGLHTRAANSVISIVPWLVCRGVDDEQVVLVGDLECLGGGGERLGRHHASDPVVQAHPLPADGGLQLSVEMRNLDGQAILYRLAAKGRG